MFACPEEYLERRRTLNDFATMFFSFGSILTFMRLTYYLQLHATLGPIVIVSSKVFTDICTMVVIYLVRTTVQWKMETFGVNFVPKSGYHNRLLLRVYLRLRQ